MHLILLVEWLALALAAPGLLFPSAGGPTLFALSASLAVGSRAFTACRLGEALIPSSIRVPVLVLAVATAVSAAVAIPVDSSLSLPKLGGMMLGLTCMVTCTASLERTTRSSTSLTMAILLVATIGIALVALVGTDWHSYKQPALQWLYNTLPNWRPLTGMAILPNRGFEPNQVAGVLVLVFPLAGISLWRSFWDLRSHGENLGSLNSRTTVWVVLSGAAWGLSALAIFMTYSRSAFLGLVAAVLAFVALKRPRLLPVCTALGLVAALAMAFSVAADFVSLPSILGSEPNVPDRLRIWRDALRMIREQPLTGIGLGTFPVASSTLRLPGPYGFPEPLPHAHNMLLQTALDLGLPGLGALTYLLVRALHVSLQSWKIARHQGDRVVCTLLEGSIVGMVAHLTFNMLDAVSLGAKPGFLFWIVLGLLNATRSQETSQAP